MKIKAAAQFSIGPLLSAAIGFITIPIVAWGFDSEDVGRLTMLQVLMSLGVMVFSLAMHQAYVREYYEVNDKALLLKTALIPGLVFFIFTGLLIFLLPTSLSSIFFDMNSSWISSLLFFGIAFNLIINILMHVIRMEQRGLAFSAAQAMPKFVLLISVLIIIFSEVTPNFVNLLAGNTVAFFLTLTICLALTYSNWRDFFRISLDFSLTKRLLGFSLPLVFGSIAYWGLTAMDRFFIKAFIGLDGLGVYAVAVTMASAATVLSMVFSNLWHPVVYRWIKAGVDPKKIEAVVESVFLLVISVWSLAGLLSCILPHFFPPEYEAVQFLVVACIAMPLFYMLSEATVVGIGITKKSAYSMAASIIAFAVNALLNYILIPRYGISGAAIASLLAFFLFFLVRTESSCYVWKPIARSMIYLVLVAYSTVTIFFVLSKGAPEVWSLVWLFLLFGAYLAFFQRIKILLVSAKLIGNT